MIESQIDKKLYHCASELIVNVKYTYRSKVCGLCKYLTDSEIKHRSLIRNGVRNIFTKHSKRRYNNIGMAKLFT